MEKSTKDVLETLFLITPVAIAAGTLLFLSIKNNLKHAANKQTEKPISSNPRDSKNKAEG